jgi:hypothetical protein
VNDNDEHLTTEVTEGTENDEEKGERQWQLRPAEEVKIASARTPLALVVVAGALAVLRALCVLR